MKKNPKGRKLRLSKETMKNVTASEWHRTTHRCHEPPPTQCDTVCITDCYAQTCWCGATATCPYVSYCECSLGCVPC